jgi:hypothetical protein
VQILFWVAFGGFFFGLTYGRPRVNATTRPVTRIISPNGSLFHLARYW